MNANELILMNLNGDPGTGNDCDPDLTIRNETGQNRRNSGESFGDREFRGQLANVLGTEGTALSRRNGSWYEAKLVIDNNRNDASPQ